MSSDPIEVLRKAIAELRQENIPTLRRATAVQKAESAIASLSAPKPEGEWVTVPREPTPAMHEAGHGASLGAGEPMHPDFIAVNRDIYAAMLAAAPKPKCRYPDCGCRSTMGDAAATEVCPKPEGAEAVAWQEGYAQGVLDERTSEANIGIAGFGAKVEPARVNPYGTAPPRPEASDGVVVAHGFYDPMTGAFDEAQRTPRWLPAVVCAAPQHPSAPVGEFVQHPSGDGTIARKSDPLTPLAVDEILAVMNRHGAPVGVEAYLVERLSGEGYGKPRRIVDARIYDPTKPEFWADDAQSRHRVTPLVPPLAQQPAADFDAWQKNPYTKVLMKSVAEDYVPKHGQQPAAVDDDARELAQWVLEAVVHDEECDAMTAFDDAPGERCTCGCSDAFAKCERILAGQQQGGES